MVSVRRETKPLFVGDREVTLHSRVWQIDLPGLTGGVIWNRPVAVTIRTASGPVTTIPVRDTTRLAELYFVALGLAALVLFFLLDRR